MRLLHGVSDNHPGRFRRELIGGAIIPSAGMPLPAAFWTLLEHVDRIVDLIKVSERHDKLGSRDGMDSDVA